MHDILTASTLKRLPEPTADPALALARAAHLVFEVSRLSVLTEGAGFNAWAADVAQAQMEALDPLWSAELNGLAIKARMPLLDAQRYRAERNALSQASLSGYKSILDSTFDQLKVLAEQIHELRAEEPGVRLAAMAASVPLPSLCDERRDELVKVVFSGNRGLSRDFRFNTALAEFHVLDRIWVKVDVVASRTLLGAQDVHQWVRGGQLQVKMDGSTKQVRLGEVCAMTGARWLLPGDRLRPSHKVSLQNGRLVFSLEGPPAIIDRDSGVIQPPLSTTSVTEGESDVVGYAIWVSRTAPYNPRVQHESENWGRKQGGGQVDVRPLLKETLVDPAGNPILYRGLSVVVRRKEHDAS